MDDLNENVESRLKNIMMQIKEDLQKDYDKKLSDTVKKEKEEMLSKIFDMFPHLELDKNDIINECLSEKADNNKKETKIKKEKCKVDEFVFDEIIHKNKKYYMDKNNGLWNIKAELVGSVIGNDNDGRPVCCLFNEKIADDIGNASQ